MYTSSSMNISIVYVAENATTWNYILHSKQPAIIVLTSIILIMISVKIFQINQLGSWDSVMNTKQQGVLEPGEEVNKEVTTG